MFTWAVVAAVVSAQAAALRPHDLAAVAALLHSAAAAAVSVLEAVVEAVARRWRAQAAAVIA